MSRFNLSAAAGAVNIGCQSRIMALFCYCIPLAAGPLFGRIQETPENAIRVALQHICIGNTSEARLV